MSPTWGVSSSVSQRMGEEKDVSGRVHGHGEEEGVPFLAEGWGQSFNYVCLAFEKSQSLSCSLFPPFLFLIFLLSHSSGFFSLYFFYVLNFLSLSSSLSYHNHHHHYHLCHHETSTHLWSELLLATSLGGDTIRPFERYPWSWPDEAACPRLPGWEVGEPSGKTGLSESAAHVLSLLSAALWHASPYLALTALPCSLSPSSDHPLSIPWTVCLPFFCLLPYTSVRLPCLVSLSPTHWNLKFSLITNGK